MRKIATLTIDGNERVTVDLQPSRLNYAPEFRYKFSGDFGGGTITVDIDNVATNITHSDALVPSRIFAPVDSGSNVYTVLGFTMADATAPDVEIEIYG